MSEPLESTEGLPQPGDVLAGKYRVERVLGSGGMGVVVAAMHLTLQERVALKFLLPEGAKKEETVTRFLREARAAAKIKSEHVARVSDVGTLESGAPYLVMEYLDGSDLSALLRRDGPLPPRDAVEYVLQACEALAEAHAVGIVHRDLKPANLFLARHAGGAPRIKVLDFGISKLTARDPSMPPDDPSMTRTRAWLGSPLYMSPEQMRSARDVDTRTDIWALGVILYELLSGKPPFDGETFPELCAQILHGDPVPLPVVAPEVPPELWAVVQRCLEKVPDKRFPSIGELVMALVDFAPRRARSVAERAVSVLEQAGLMRASNVPRHALDGTLPEPMVSPFRHSSPPAAPPAPAPMAAPARTSDPRISAPPPASARTADDVAPRRSSGAAIAAAAVVLLAVVGVGYWKLAPRGAPDDAPAGPSSATAVATAPTASATVEPPVVTPPPSAAPAPSVAAAVDAGALVDAATPPAVAPAPDAGLKGVPRVPVPPGIKPPNPPVGAPPAPPQEPPTGIAKTPPPPNPDLNTAPPCRKVLADGTLVPCD